MIFPRIFDNLESFKHFFVHLFCCLALLVVSEPKKVLVFFEKCFIMYYIENWERPFKNHIMKKEQKIIRLQTQLNEWTARLNKSRKNSLRAMRAMHVNHIQKELDALKGSWKKLSYTLDFKDYSVRLYKELR